MLVFFILTIFAQKYQSGTIIKDTTWREKDCPFYIKSQLYIDSGVTLTIEPGSVVFFDDPQWRIDVNGKLIADGVSFKYNRTEYRKNNYALNENYETWLMPGLGYAMYQPNSSDSIGLFSGLSVEYLIYGKVRQNDDSGPSHVRWYARLSILKSDDKTRNSMFSYLLGVDMSLEKNPKRTFLIPYFGVEFGGLSQKQFVSTVQFTPTFGIHLISKKNMYINVHGGYVYPIDNFEALQGWTGQVGVNFALW